MERSVQLLKQIHHRKELWKIAVKVKDKWNVLKDGKHSLEILVVDAKGDDIVVIVPNELYAKFEKEIIESNTYCFQNFHVINNEDQFKLSEHKYKLRLNGATRLCDVNVHKIPDPTPKFKDFVEIQTGKWRGDVLYNVIGVLDDVGYTQPDKGSRKVQVNFRLRDLSDNTIQCTLWEDYGIRFITYTRDKCDAGPTIIFMKYAKIKPEGKFPLTVSNTWSTTKLFINDIVPEIVEFKKSLDLAISNGTFVATVDTPSQLMSQYSGGSQYTPEQKFCHKSEIMPLSKMINLTMDTSVVTVVETIAVKGSKNGWYFQGCVHCPKATSGDKPPYHCDTGHPTEIKIWKYRLDVDVAYDNTETTFTFWDRECTQLLGISAADLRDQSIAAGINDPLDYPAIIDSIEGRTLVTRVKWQTKWNNASVNGVHEGKDFIAEIISQFPAVQDSKMPDILPSPILEDVSSAQSVGKNDDCVIPTISLSVTDEIDPDQVSTITPSKRTGASLLPGNQNDEVQDLIGSKLSATKMAKQPKITKHPKME